MKPSNGVIQVVSWQDYSAELRAVRENVFVREQQVPLDLEWDGLDEDAVHFLAQDDNNKPIGCARLLSDGQVGRVAVEKALRGHGIGHKLMHAVIQYGVEHNYPTLFLHSQLSAKPFYLSLGFVPYSDVYDEAGIEHISMKQAN